MCVFESHPLTQHDVVRLIDILDERKKALKNQVNCLRKSTNEELTKQETALKNCEKTMLRILQKCAMFRGYVQVLDSILKETKRTTGMMLLNAREKEFADLEKKIKVDIQSESGNACIFLPNCEHSEANEDEERCENADKRDEEYETPQETSSDICVGLTIYQLGGHLSQLERDNGRLLLCTDPYSSNRLLYKVCR